MIASWIGFVNWKCSQKIMTRMNDFATGKYLQTFDLWNIITEMATQWKIEIKSWWPSDNGTLKEILQKRDCLEAEDIFICDIVLLLAPSDTAINRIYFQSLLVIYTNKIEFPLNSRLYLLKFNGCILFYTWKEIFTFK